MPELKVGDTFPTNVTSVTEDNPGKVVDLAKELSSGKVIIFGVPGAFTPTCSGKHVPSYVQDFDSLKAKGVDKIVCVSVNDAFVMHEWQRDTKADKLRFWADASGDLAKATGLDADFKPLGGTRFKRFAAVLENGKVTQIHVEPDNSGATCTLAPHLKL